MYQTLDDDVDTVNELVSILDDMKALKAISVSDHARIKDHLVGHFNENLEAVIKSTIEDRTRADKEQVLHLLTKVKDKGAWKDEVKKYLDDILIPLDSVMDIEGKFGEIEVSAVKIILRQIDGIRRKVKKVFRYLVTALDKEKVLLDLKNENMIDEEQYKKLQITPRSIQAISNVVRGKGLYLMKSYRGAGTGILNDIVRSIPLLGPVLNAIGIV